MGKNNARRTIIIILAIVMLFGAAGINMEVHVAG